MREEFRSVSASQAHLESSACALNSPRASVDLSLYAKTLQTVTTILATITPLLYVDAPVCRTVLSSLPCKLSDMWGEGRIISRGTDAAGDISHASVLGCKHLCCNCVHEALHARKAFKGQGEFCSESVWAKRCTPWSPCSFQ